MQASVAEKRIDLRLDDDQQITLTGPVSGEYDICAKSWGFYASPSFRTRLRKFGLRPVLFKDAKNHRRFAIVESARTDIFSKWLAEMKGVVVAWLDEEPDALLRALKD